MTHERDIAELKVSFSKMSTDVLRGMTPDVTKEVASQVSPPAFDSLAEFEASDAATVKRILAETQQTAKLGTVQMSDVTELLVGAGYDSTMVHSILATLSQVMHGKKIPYSDLKTD